MNGGTQRLAAPIALLALAALMTTGCGKQEEPAPEGPGTAASAAPIPSASAEAEAETPEAAPKPVEIPEGEHPDEVQTEEDFEEAAAKTITEDNLEAELDAIEKEISAEG